jgi:3-hydroxyisobutyrate dehydrogenase-like beta-hydroxyacid dehydrogenase
MSKLKIGFLHPGQMGISVAASAQNTGHSVYWVSEGRSQQTHERAARFGLLDAHSLEKLCETCSVIISICPPHAAQKVAAQVATCAFQGLYVDANAISPMQVIRIGQVITEAGATFVDGGIIGGPAWESGTTWLYLSGKEAFLAASCFAAGPLETSVIGESIGKASSLKMCYAAYTKGTSALLCAILTAAEALDVREDLERQWSRNDSQFAEQAGQRVRRVTAKAWRFAGEMDEIAATFRQAGVPGEFHATAATLYRRMAHFKDAPETPPLEDVLATLLRSEETETA